MYLVTYEKKNGDIIYRTRNSIPGYIGDITSMGWIIKNIQYNFKGKYYDFREYKKISQRHYKINHILKALNRYIKKYGFNAILMILIILYLFK